MKGEEVGKRAEMKAWAVEWEVRKRPETVKYNEMSTVGRLKSKATDLRRRRRGAYVMHTFTVLLMKANRQILRAPHEQPGLTRTHSP